MRFGDRPTGTARWLPVSPLTVDPAGTHLVRDGQPFPLIVDTAWSAFADASAADWRYYLDTRRTQGFTAVAVSVLPILHDRTVRTDAREPFAVTADGHYDFDSPDRAYLANAKEFAELASTAGLLLVIVVLWCNYVPGTWGADLTPWAVMNPDQRRRHVSRVTQTFAPFDAIFAISGDEHFTDPRSVTAYREALDQVATEAPQCLRTMHSTPTADLPAVIADSPHLDFYSYQSGHVMATQHLCIDLAERYVHQKVRRPVINLEPAYEGGGAAGRLPAADVRRGMWWSILAGAAAGIGYGANGVWQWHVHAGTYTKSAPEPFSWQRALAFEGVQDVSLAAALIRDHGLFRAVGRQDLVRAAPAGCRAAATPDPDPDTAVAVYLPYAAIVTLDVDLTGHALRAWALAERQEIRARSTRDDGGTRVDQLDVTGDILLIFEPVGPVGQRHS